MTESTTKPMLRPLGDRVLISMDSRKSESRGGIAIPDRAQTTEEWGTVLAAGEKAAHVIPGDRVFVSKTQGTRYVEGGRDFILLEEGKILCRETRAADLFAVGDIAQLRSGSPDLTVTALEGSNVHVEWEGGERNDFPYACLMLIRRAADERPFAES